MSGSIIALWCAGAIGKGAVATQLGRRGLAVRYPALVGALAVSCVRSCWCLGMLAASGWKAYGAAWAATQPLALLSGWLMATEVLYTMARHYPRGWWLTTLLSAPLNLIGGAAGAGMWPLPHAGAYGLLYQAGRSVYAMAWFLVVAGGALFRWLEIGRASCRERVSSPV